MIDSNSNCNLICLNIWIMDKNIRFLQYYYIEGIHIQVIIMLSLEIHLKKAIGILKISKIGKRVRIVRKKNQLKEYLEKRKKEKHIINFNSKI